MKMKSTSNCKLVMLLISLFFCSCQRELTQNDKIISSAIYFNKDKKVIPEAIINTLTDFDNILIGETHYVKEHEEFLSLLIKQLYYEGFQVVFLEDMQANTYIYDLYVKSKIELDEIYLGINKEILNSIREFNQLLINKNKPLISVVNVDLNHDKQIYAKAMKKMIEFYNGSAILKNKISSLDFDDIKYKDKISDLIIYIKEDSRFNEIVIQQLVDISEKELLSVSIKEDWKNNKSNQKRENFIFGEITSKKNQLHNNEKTIINLGLWHAQKKNQWDLGEIGLKTVGELLQERYKNNVYHFFTLGYKGEKKANFRSKNRDKVDMINNDLPDNIIKKLGKKDSTMNTFINFNSMNYHDELSIGFYNEVLSIVPEVIIDGILIYSNISVSEVSLKYEL